MIILIKKILSILKAPREMEGGEEEPTDLIQKTITFVSSSLLFLHHLTEPFLNMTSAAQGFVYS